MLSVSKKAASSVSIGNGNLRNYDKYLSKPWVVHKAALNDLLHLAVKNGFAEMIDLFIGNGANVDAVDHLGRSALYYACAKGDVKTVQALLEEGASQNIVEATGFTALFYAVQSANVAVVNALLKAGANANASASGTTPVMLAAAQGHGDIVRVLVQAGAAVDAANANGITPLALAVMNNHVDAVKALMEHGAIENQTAGSDALILATRLNHAGVVNALVQGGVEVHAVRGQASALMWAVECGHREVVAVLERAGADLNSHLLVAAQDGAVDVVHALLDFGADYRCLLPAARESSSIVLEHAYYQAVEHVAGKSVSGETLLMQAARLGQLEAVNTMLRAGVDANAVDALGRTALFHAVYHGRMDVTKALIEARNDVNIPASKGLTVLMLAAAFDDPGLISELTGAGADTSATDSLGHSAMAYALGYGHVGAIRALAQAGEDLKVHLCETVRVSRADKVAALLAAGADAEAVDAMGTPLPLLAAMAGHVDNLKILLKAGANPDAATSDGVTALMCAAMQGHADVVALLLQAKVNINASCRDGTSALALAHLRGNTDIVQMLQHAGAHEAASALEPTQGQGPAEPAQSLTQAEGTLDGTPAEMAAADRLVRAKAVAGTMLAEDGPAHREGWSLPLRAVGSYHSSDAGDISMSAGDSHEAPSSPPRGGDRPCPADTWETLISSGYTSATQWSSSAMEDDRITGWLDVFSGSEDGPASSADACADSSRELPEPPASEQQALIVSYGGEPMFGSAMHH